MEMPKPSADHQRLEKVAGIWKGTEKMYPSQWDPKGGEAEGITRARVALSGFAVVVDYEQSRGGKVTFEGHGVYTWDPARSEVCLYWFDPMTPGAEEFRGGWKGDVMTLASKNPMGHMRMTYDFSKPGVLGSRMEISQDGKQWSTLFDGTYTRQD